MRKKLSVKCPECDYDFSSKGDFLRYAEPGETIQCPACGTELRVTRGLQLEAIDLGSLDDLG